MRSTRTEMAAVVVLAWALGAWACSGDGGREWELDSGPDDAAVDDDAAAEGEPGEADADTGDEPEVAEPPEEDGGAGGVDGGRDDSGGNDGVCVDPCIECTPDVDSCCGYNICQDDWSGVNRCMPVVPPHSGSCPTDQPVTGDECPELGLICRYDSQERCKCGCEGWNCPYDGA